MTLVFLHIPKSGGTTLHKIIERQYPRGPHLFAPDNHQGVQQLGALSPAEREALVVVRGHLYFGVHTQLKPPVQHITMLRDPISRTISYYRHIQRQTAHPLHTVVQENQISLAALVQGKHAIDMVNGQVRQLLGMGLRADEMVTPAHLAQVQQQIIDHDIIVGLTTAFDRSVLLMAHRLGWSMPYYGRRNETPVSYQQPVDETTRALIAEHNQLDRQLYDWALDRLTTQWAATPDADARLRRFRQVNRAFALIDRAYYNVQRIGNKLRGK
jgi:hypothetical protein